MGIYTQAALLPCAYLFYWIIRAICRLYIHPLSRFPGPPIAASTTLYKAYIDVHENLSLVHELKKLHDIYGDIVRIGPNELHFARPEVYHEIYNSRNRWDKEESLYHSFGEDRSSFGFLTYAEAKPRKDILTRIFSKKSVRDAEELVQDKVLELCDSFVAKAGKPVDLYFAFRCVSMDVITYLCFGHPVNALKVPNYQAPILVSMDACQPVFVRFKHSKLYKNMIIKCPPNISRIISPETTGLINLQEALKNQVASLSNDPEHLKKLPHSTTIWNELLRPELHPGGVVPDVGSLFEESQALLFGGSDTIGLALMHGTFEISRRPDVFKKLRVELVEAWPDLSENPSHTTLEGLSYLSAVIKESLRIYPGIPSPLPRIVPAEGAKLSGEQIPGGTIVGESTIFVHMDEEIFPEPYKFRPERWLEPSSKTLDKWMLAFSRGPRSCVGLNLAWAELYLTFGHVFRKFDVEIDSSSPMELKWLDYFGPKYLGNHLKARMIPVEK